MNHGLVLLSGLGFILISGLVFLVLHLFETYSLSRNTRLVLHLAAFSFLAVLCILIFDWYSSEYIRILEVS